MNNNSFHIGAFIISVIMTLASCDNNKNDVVNIKLSETIPTIKSERISVDAEMLRPARLFTSNNKLIVFDDVNQDIFKIFELPNLKYLYCYGSRGEGPNQFNRPLDKECINIGNNTIEVLYRNKILNYQITDSTFADLNSEDSERLVLTNVSPLNNFKKVSDNAYIYNNLSGKMELCRNDLSANNETFFGEIPDNILTLNEQEKMMSLSKTICASPQKQRFATFYYFRPTFKIYDSNSNLLKNVVIENTDISGDGVLYFTDAFATPQFIYAMWIGKSKNEVGNSIETFRPEILVFDWDGKLKNHVRLDQPIITFAVSQDDRELYAVSFIESDSAAIYKYNLSAN